MYRGKRRAASPATSSKRDRNAQEGCRNGGGIRALAAVLAVEEIDQLLFQIGSSTVLGRGLKRIHRRPVEIPKLGDEFRWCAGKVERVRVSTERDLLFWNPR